MAEQLVPPVETGRVSAQKPFHARDQIGLRRFDNQMKMVQPQTIGMHLPAGLAADFAQRFQETLPIPVIFENRFPPITSIHHVIDRARILDTEFSRHARRKESDARYRQW